MCREDWLSKFCDQRKDVSMYQTVDVLGYDLDHKKDKSWKKKMMSSDGFLNNNLPEIDNTPNNNNELIDEKDYDLVDKNNNQIWCFLHYSGRLQESENTFQMDLNYKQVNCYTYDQLKKAVFTTSVLNDSFHYCGFQNTDKIPNFDKNFESLFYDISERLALTIFMKIGKENTDLLEAMESLIAENKKMKENLRQNKERKNKSTNLSASLKKQMKEIKANHLKNCKDTKESKEDLLKKVFDDLLLMKNG
jgi:hypothetical protein